MIRLRFNQSRNPAKNLRWALNHGICVTVLASILAVANIAKSSLDHVFLGFIVVGVICSSCYFLGYLSIAIFWQASKNFPWFGSWYRKNNSAVEDLEIWHQIAINEFKATVIKSTHEKMQLDGSKAEIIKIERSGESLRPERSAFFVNIYSRNDHGEYFLFKKTGLKKPYIKHIEKSV